MPGGMSEPLWGGLAFTSIKFVGYSLAGLYLNKSYPNATPNFLTVGATRTIIGIFFGTILAMFSFPFVFVGGVGLLIYIVGLIPVRLFEWFLIIRFFYDQNLEDRPKMWRSIIFGTVWSFLLDIPSLIGLFVIGKFWIC
jgi:hypothetical protein